MNAAESAACWEQAAQGAEREAGKAVSDAHRVEAFLRAQRCREMARQVLGGDQ